MSKQSKDKLIAATDGLPKGWTRQNFQIPVGLSKIFRVEAASEGHGGVKTLGTAGIALILGLPHEIRECLYREVLVNSRQPDEITPEVAWTVFLEALRKVDSDEFYISRILDPEVTPKPGEKASDRRKPIRKKSG